MRDDVWIWWEAPGPELAAIAGRVPLAGARIASPPPAPGGGAGAPWAVEVPCPPGVAASPRAACAFAEALDGMLRVRSALSVVVGLPGSGAGLAALEALTAGGVSTTIDGIIAPSQHARAASAYMRGLERRSAAGLPIGGVRSVAWVPLDPVERWCAGRLPAASPLRGSMAVATGQRMYMEAARAFSGRRWRRLAARGGQPQRTGLRAFPAGEWALRRLALPGTALALSPGQHPPPAAGDAVLREEPDETEVAWVLGQAARAGVELEAMALEVGRMLQHRARLAPRAALAALAERSGAALEPARPHRRVEVGVRRRRR